ncbi:MAG: GldG family protein, partial [Gemmatimonadetes bacterium]|nr:GldG family protein [Gemmatimonadota bacterium]
MKSLVSSAGYLGLILVLVSGYLYVSDATTQRTALIVLLAGLALGSAWMVFEWEKVWNLLGRRTTRYGANTAVLVLLVIGILAFANMIGSRYTQRYDATANKRFSLADLSVSVLSELEQEVHIVGFFRSSGPDATNRHLLDDMLNQFQYHSDHITYEFIDPDLDPSIARQYNISSYGTVVFESEGKTEHINRYLEENVTNALVKVTREGQKTVYFLEGHGEHNVNLTDQAGYNRIMQLLENQSYSVRSFSLLSEVEVPADCNVLVVAGPRTNLVGNEQEAIRNYLDRGGRALFLINPDYPEESADLSALLAHWKVRIGDNVVIDESAVGRLPGMNEY